MLGTATVIVELGDGKRIWKRVDRPKGHPGNPLPASELEDKFRDLASVLLNVREMRSVIKIVRDLENLSQLDDLLALVRVDK